MSSPIVHAFDQLGLWPVQRAAQLTDTLRRMGARTSLRFTWIPAPENAFIDYFAPAMADDLAGIAGWEFLPHHDALDWSLVDAVVLTCHGSDISTRLFELRRRNPNMLVLLWMFDNHVAQINNLKTAQAADLWFPSHAYESAYLANPASPLGAHLPACSAQWTVPEARALLAGADWRDRSDKLLVNYVDYQFSWRSQLLHRLRAEVPEADVLLMPATDRTRYFGKSRGERLHEWLHHKSTLILPVANDLSTRVFDALLAGQVVIAPRSIRDFDAVFDAATQQALGMVRIDDFEIPTIRAAIAEAVRRFDAMGEAGVRARSEFVLGGHMFRHRIEALLGLVRQVGQPGIAVRLCEGPGLPLGLRFVSA